MSNIYQKLGLPRVINGNGKMTYLGVSTLSKGVVKAFAEASQNYVVVDDFIDVVGKKLSAFTLGEDTCVTASASAGIAIAIAAIIAKEDLVLIERMPNSEGLKNQVIIQKGHVINYGTAISTMVTLGGGALVEVGQANLVGKEHIINSINEKTCALLYVKSHHSVQKGMVSLEEMVAIAKEYNLPIIVDAAAEEDLQKYLKLGADLVIYSGAKALAGPTSGFITGKASLIAACKAQYKGIGRAMKVGKETIAALYQAVLEYMTENHQANIEQQKRIIDYLWQELKGVPNLDCTVSKDEAGREIYRLKILVGANSPKNAEKILEELKAGEISIHLRNHYANVGIISIDPRGLVEGDKEIIVEKIKRVIN